MKSNKRIENLVMTGLMMALVTVVTAILPIPVPFTNGYIHLGDSMIFLAVIILGWKRGAVAAAFGSAFADLFLGFVYWAPWTFVIKGGMALILGLIMYQAAKSKLSFVVTGVSLVAFWVAFNYVVQQIIKFEHNRDASSLIDGSGVAHASEFGDFLSQMESWLMIGALTIPLILIAVVVIYTRSKNKTLPLSQILAMSGSGIFMVFGYYIAGGLIYGNFAVSAFSVPFNILQFVVGFVLATVISAALSKTPLKSKMAYYSAQTQNI